MTEGGPSKLDEAVRRLNAFDRALEPKNIRPKDAATLMILDRTAGGETRVLMGRRHGRHKFMPGAFVFPGGRVDPGDWRVRAADDYRPDVMARMTQAMGGSKGPARARALGIAALRETYEEAGLFIGRRAPTAATPPKPADPFAAFAERGILPALGALRLVARAITPPRRIRRFDTRFLACFADEIVDRLPEGVGPSGELEDVAWLTFDEAKKTEIPPITVTILEEIDARLGLDPRLDASVPIPFYRWFGKGFRRDLI